MNEQMNISEENKFLYTDSKYFSYLLKTIELRYLTIHTMLTIGLYEVKNGSDEITMPFLLSFAEEWSLDNQFIDWIEEYTPYKYSAKKKRIMQNNKKFWNISSAFLNPYFSNKKLLQVEIRKLPDIRQESDKFEFFDLGVLLDQLNEELDRYEKLVKSKERKHKNYSKNLSCPSDSSNKVKKTKNRRKSKKGKSSNNFPVQKSSNSSSEINKLSIEEKEILDKNHNMIKKYLSQNPLPDNVGPLGVPQSKYRYGTYGINSMEYDAWSRWRKN